MKILIIEDEADLRQSIHAYLTSQRFLCEEASDFALADEKIALYSYDLILLDITLPGGNGLDLLPRIRERNPEAGVLILSARDSLDDKLTGLDQGADDYLTKPFHLAELNSRLHAILRRGKPEARSTFQQGEVEADLRAGSISIQGKKLDLTRREYDLYLFFLQNAGRVLTHAGIAEHVWGDHADSADNFDFLYTHIRNLRKKIQAAGGADNIRTVYGLGYTYSKE